ncbi:MAG: hypothetical protein B7X10_00805 [Burkholderiales bacterium 21-58-4]|nr:MAG: hypothetical protein B7X10_00805 [Burkholderiales bacterium 21-58-4]
MSGYVPANISGYLALVPSANQKPKFLAVLSAVIQPFADMQSLCSTMPSPVFDLDYAVGQQLDMLGEWIGVTRNLEVPLTGVFFSLDTAGLGLDEGILFGPYTPSDGLEQLPDEQYRLVLRVKIANNHWDGSLEGAYTLLNALFAGKVFTPFIQDLGDMTMSMGLAGGLVDPVSFALLTQGYLDLKPMGVTMVSYITPSVSGPIFALDLENTLFAGLDVGALATITPA